jgi:hypothetical protein
VLAEIFAQSASYRTASLHVRCVLDHTRASLVSATNRGVKTKEGRMCVRVAYKCGNVTWYSPCTDCVNSAQHTNLTLTWVSGGRRHSISSCSHRCHNYTVFCSGRSVMNIIYCTKQLEYNGEISRRSALTAKWNCSTVVKENQLNTMSLGFPNRLSELPKFFDPSALLLTFKNLAVSLRSTSFNIQKFYMVLALRWVFIRISEQTANLALCHYLIGFYNRCGKCLQHGTDSFLI